MSNKKKILFIDNNLNPQIDLISLFIEKEWPRAKILFLIKKAAKVSNIANRTFHIYKRESPSSISEGLKLAFRIRRIKPDIILIRKHDLTVKRLISILMCKQAEVYLWKMYANGMLSISKINRISLLTKPFNKPRFLSSLILSFLPLMFVAFLLPTLWLKRCSSGKKKEFWDILSGNLYQGPMGDSPWLWAWLQLVMLWVFLFSKETECKNPSRILIIRNDHIGDAVNTVPLVRYIRKIYPEAYIAILCDTGEFLWKECPYIDEVLIYKTTNRLFYRQAKKLRYIFRPFTYARVLRKKRFDLVLDPVGRTETHILSYLCPNANRLSSTYYPYNLFDNTIVYRHYESGLHETQRALSLVKPKREITNQDCALEIWLKAEIWEWAKYYLQLSGLTDKNRIISIHPGAMTPLRLWPIEQFAIVACELADKYDMKIMFFEPPGDYELTEKFISKLSNFGHTAIVVRNIDIPSLTALISKSNLFLCNDSGPMNLAAATRTPMVSIFGPGEYFRWQPLHRESAIVRKTVACSPCSQNDCTNPICILQIDIRDVFQAAEKILSQSHRKTNILNST